MAKRPFLDGYKLDGHEHSVSLVQHHDDLECDACDRSYGGGFSCSKCKFTIHLRCKFVFEFQEIVDHPSHAGHCLKLLTTGAPDHTDPKCHICGKNTKRLLYHCSNCKLNLDIDCIIDAMCARANLNMPWHPHPLLMVDFVSDMICDFCFGKVGIDAYFCPRCRLLIHESCVSQFVSEISHPFHVRHPLKLITNGAPDYIDRSCHICGDTTGNLLYHCDICKFNLNLVCAVENPPPISLSNTKVHEHTLTLMPRLICFVCDACGTEGDRAPYVCVQCDFMIFHQECAQFPLVIHINHHDHRVSYKYPLGLGEWRCGVCLEEIDWSYGAYSCSLCPNYAIHSRCATRIDVWEGEELDGEPEEVEDIEPFKSNDDNTITHFAHEHKLILSKDGIALKESILCGACVRPIGSNTFYYCSDCSFILHETCANLPKKKRHFLSPTKLTLLPIGDRTIEKCDACHQTCCKGSMYYDEYNQSFDLLCSTVSVPFIHGSHPHPLIYLKLDIFRHPKTCQNCGMDEKEVVIGCKKCDYFLDFRCATLPLTVTLPRYDDHPLTLCYGDEKASDKYWCDICERETNPKTWFYTCKDCGVTLHVFCVVGDIRYAKPGGKVENTVELMPNNTSSRSLCHVCHCRCPGPFVLKDYIYGIFYCSFYCLTLFKTRKGYTVSTTDKVICPPWALGPNT